MRPLHQCVVRLALQLDLGGSAQPQLRRRLQALENRSVARRWLQRHVEALVPCALGTSQACKRVQRAGILAQRVRLERRADSARAPNDTALVK
eukprot:1895498-Prymnesium_polylepis.1